MSLKNKIFEKLEDAVSGADASTVDGVQILALSASTVKNLNEGTDLEDDVYSIGIAGEIGFGVATCPADLIPSGWRGLVGHDNKISENYGNYVDTNGSALVYIPKHYFKYDGNTCLISHRQLSGYVIDRSFINGGKERNGVFVYKYGGSNTNGIFTSKKLKDPISTSSSHNPVASINGATENNYGELYQAVKSAGSEYYLTSIFNYTMLARLAFAHGKSANTTIACAYKDVAPFMPKGNLGNALKDINDSSVTFTPSGYSNCALTGSGEPFAKTTHNGQECGIADLNGNMWEVASGFIRTDANGFLMLKESVDIANIINDGTSGGAYDIALYDVVDISDTVSSNAGWTYLGNGSNAVFGMSTDRNNVTYKKTALGIPNSTGTSGSGTTEFGNDGIYRYLRNDMACLCGGLWGDSSDAGAFAMNLYYSRTNSNYTVGGRASVLV